MSAARGQAATEGRYRFVSGSQDTHEDECDDHEARERQVEADGTQRQGRQRQLWLKKARSGTRGFSAGVTSTCEGESRKTLLVTFSIEPCRPKISPAAKSTTRLASASAMSPRFMMTGMPLRNASPIALA